ncbi:MAG: hypothetical protein ABSC04_15005 [Syntrophobacteraceae bacterium]|jgi:predicted HicB family RNase H-like nuclease
MKGLVLRIPEEVLAWVRNEAARQTIKRGRQVSMNALVLELLRREMEADAHKQKIKSLTGHECQGYG